MFKDKLRDKNSFNQIYKNFLISNLVSSICILIVGLILIISVSVLPFPTRYDAAAFDNEMIAEGQLTCYYILFSCGGIGIIFYVMHLITSGFLNYFVLVYKTQYIKKINYFYFGLIAFFMLLIPIFPCIYFWYFYKKNTFVATNTKKTKIWMSSYLCLVPFVTASIVVPSILITPTTVYVEEKAVEQNITYSTNHKNVVVLYYDRAYNLFWNYLLYIDQELNKDKSFINMFPEFTSYMSVVANSTPTNLSNMTLLGSMWYTPYLLGKSVINPISKKTYNQYEQQDYLNETLTNMVDIINQYGFKEINFMDSPYYGKTFNSLSGEYWNQSKFLNQHSNTAYATSSSAVLKHFNIKPHVNNVDSANYDNSILGFQKDDKPQYLKFKNTDSGTFKFLYHQNTHGPYVYKDGGKMIRTNDLNENFLRSMWSTIQWLKKYFTIMKQQKMDNGESVYDNTMFMIISDHGTNLSSRNDVLYNKLWDQYIKGSELSKENTYKFSLQRGSINPIMMVKPFKESVDNKLTVLKKDNEFFNQTNLLSLSDIPLIIEAELYKIQNKSKPISSFYLPSYNPNDYDTVAKKFYINNIVIDPLNNEAKNNLREFRIYNSSNWQWRYKDKTFAFYSYLEMNFKENFKTIYHTAPGDYVVLNKNENS